MLFDVTYYHFSYISAIVFNHIGIMMIPPKLCNYLVCFLKKGTKHSQLYIRIRVVTCTCRLAVALFVIRFIASDYPSEHLNKLFFKYHWKAQIGKKKILNTYGVFHLLQPQQN